MDQMRNQARGDDDLDRPNQASNKEPAEGSRENAGAESDEKAGGITNRPLDREIEEQESVPPRGRTKDEENRG